jgi:hypothetical protein
VRTARWLVRAASCGLVALAGLTCTDGPTHPGAADATVRFAPQFSAADGATLRSLGAFGFTIDAVRVRIQHADRLSAAGLDTVIAVPVGKDTLRLSFPFTLDGATERLKITVDLRDALQVLFSGTQLITATAGATSGGALPIIPITYVGPGAGIVRVTVAPRDTIIGLQGSVQYRYSALDAADAPATDATVAWSLSNSALGTIGSQTGAFTSNGTEGVTRVYAATPNGATDSTILTVAGLPSRVVVVSGGGQTGVAGGALPNPLVVQARTPAGLPAAGVSVSFLAPPTGAVTPALAVTDSAGKAQTVMTLARVGGPQAFLAFGDGLSADSAIETATAGPPAAMHKVVGDSEIVAGGTVVPIPPAVQIVDAQGNALPGVSVTFTVTAGGGSLTGGTTLTGVTGIAAVGSWTVGTSGAQTLAATSGNLTGAFTALLLAPIGSVASTRLQTHLDTLPSLGDTLTLIAQAFDNVGLPLLGAFTWTSRTPGVVNVNTTGLVTSVANGSAWVVATERGGTMDSARIVVQQRPTAVVVSPASVNVYLTRTSKLTAVAYDARGNALTGAVPFSWSSDTPTIAAVDTTGLILAFGLGQAKISATTGGVAGSAQVHVLTPITRIVVGRDSAGIPVPDGTPVTTLGDVRAYIAVAHDTLDAPMTGVVIGWTSSDPSVAAIDSTTGPTTRATALANGTTKLTATTQGVTGSALLTVAVPKLQLGWTTMPLGIGQYVDSEYVYLPAPLTLGGTVSLNHVGKGYASSVPSVTVAANSDTSARFRLIGQARGTDTLVASVVLAAASYLPDSAYTVVDSGRVDPIAGWPDTLVAGDSVLITLSARDPSGNVRHVVAPTIWTLSAPSALFEFHVGGNVARAFTIPQDSSLVTMYLVGLKPGVDKAVLTAAAYRTYTSPPLTIIP